MAASTLFRRRVLRILVLSFSALWITTVTAQTAPARYVLDIPSQNLESALQAVALAVNGKMLYEQELLSGKVTDPLRGEFTAEEAVQRLLMGTDLTYEFTSSSVVLIRHKARERSSEARQADDVKMALAAADADSSGSSEQSEKNNQSSREAIQEIIVTAQKREQRAFDVPISIVAVGADELQKRRITNLEDLSFAVPGLSVQSNGGYQRRIVLRGISNVFGNASLIGMYLDEASVTTAPTAQLDLRSYDLERVEVLRGPQGTLYGEGSVGGTIRFITKNPLLDDFGMNADVAAMFTEDGEPSQRIEGALNVPLIKNELGLRIAGTHDRQGGWINQPAAGHNDFNDQNLSEVRIKALWAPAPQFTANAMAVIHRNDASFTGGEDADGNFTQTFFDPTLVPDVQDDYDLFNLTLTYDFSAVRVLSTTSYIEQDKLMRGTSLKLQIAPPPTPRFHFNNRRLALNNEILTQELRLTSIGSGRVQWTIGGFYRDSQGDSQNDALLGLPDVFTVTLPGQGSSSSKSWAAFGDLSYGLTDRVTLGAGLRYFEDDQEAIGVLPIATNQAASFHALNPRVYAQYELTDQVNTYASIAKGFRSGGFNAQNEPPYDPESVWTYELGTKMSFAGGRLSADASLFYSDYQDYQILGVALFDDNTNFLQIISNAGNATIQGIEWALSWRPTEQWSLAFSGNYVDSEFDEINATSTSHLAGDPLDLFPKYGYTVSTQRDFSLNGKPGFARLDYNNHGRSTFRNRSVGPWYYGESDVVGILNLNIGLRWNERLSLGLLAQNLFNDRGFTDPFDNTDRFASRARPRTYGIEFGLTFD